MPASARDQVGEILVVDDVPENLIAIEAALDGLCEGVVMAASGEEALRYLLDRDFALILLDVQMPSMNGLETARMIRRRRRTRHVPVIFITAYDRDDCEVLDAYRLGAVDFLHKPINAEILRAKASVFVELQRRTAEVARQAVLIKEHEQAVRERALAEQRRRLEAEALRRRLAEQNHHAEELTRSNRELEDIRAQLEASNRQLAEADRRKDEFIAVLAHELRNPLAALMSGLELLETDPTAKVVSSVRPIMQRQGQHLIRLVDDLLDIARITSGKMKLRAQLVRVDEILDDAVKLATPIVEAHGHALTVASDCEDDVRIHGDPVRLAQIVANLLSNAARYTERGGHIQLAARCDPEGVRMIVTDNGRGMSPELVERVFDMFVQGKAGGGGGLGIGLTLVRTLTQMHGGEVAARSDGPGRGSEFEIRLPRADLDPGLRPGAAAEATAEAAEAAEHLRVALIDDNQDLRELTRAILERWGHAVVEAEDGIAGAALIIAERPDVAIVDIGLRDIDGYEVARRIRAALGEACPRLIAMTGYGQDKDRARALAAGFDAHLSKPTPSDALRSAISQLPT